MRLMLVNLRSKLTAFRRVFEKDQPGMQSLTTMAGLRTMRTLYLVTETAAFLENVYLAGFCMRLIFEGAVTEIKQTVRSPPLRRWY
jgi:hypothetical protein